MVNSSARHCKRCQSKIQDAVRAVDTGGVGAAVDTSAGGGRDTDAVHDRPRATSDVLGLQLLQRACTKDRTRENRWRKGEGGQKSVGGHIHTHVPVQFFSPLLQSALQRHVAL